MVAHACLSALRRPREKNCGDSEASLGYGVNKHGYSVSSVFYVYIVHSFKLYISVVLM